MKSCAAVVVVLLAGCGDRPFGMAPISGTIKYDDDSPIQGEMVTLTFIPQTEAIDEKTHPRPGRVTVNPADGSFDNVSTYEYGDGVITGEHKVTIRATGANDTGTLAIPPEYSSVATTPLKITVSPESTFFELTVPKPAK